MDADDYADMWACRDRDETAEVTVESVLRETEMAWQFVIDGIERWIPKSQIDTSDDVIRGADGECVVEIKTWLLDDIGIDYEY